MKTRLVSPMKRFPKGHVVCGPKTVWCEVAKGATSAKPKRSPIHYVRTLEDVMAARSATVSCGGCGGVAV